MSDTAILLLIIMVPLGLFLLLKVNQLRARIRNHGKSDRDFAVDATDMSELDRQMELGKQSDHHRSAGFAIFKPKKVTDLQQYAKSFVPKDKK